MVEKFFTKHGFDWPFLHDMVCIVVILVFTYLAARGLQT